MEGVNEVNSTPKSGKTKTVIIITLILIIFILIFFIFFKPTRNSTGITGNSYLFASPLSAKAGIEKIRITIYVLNNQGLGVPGKPVVIANNAAKLNIHPVQSTTDDLGRAVYDLSSPQVGPFTIQAVADGVLLPQKASIIFN